MEKEKISRVTITISEDMLEKVDDLAWQNRMDRSSFIRAALVPFITGQKALSKKKVKA